jgi:hypothetical protein
VGSRAGIDVLENSLVTCTCQYLNSRSSSPQPIHCTLSRAVYVVIYTVRSESCCALRLWYVKIWLSVSKLPLKCAVVSLYSLVKQRLMCNTGKVCNCLIQFSLSMVLSISGVPKGVNPPPPPKFRSFDKAEPNSQFREKYIHNNLIRIQVSLICKYSGTPD